MPVRADLLNDQIPAVPGPIAGPLMVSFPSALGTPSLSSALLS